ncbi:MBL fold metallo-hydrolase, partial [candidate division KSB1 bacterium]
VISFISCNSDSISKKVDELIQVEKLNDKAINVRLGYDAVTAIATQKGMVVIDAGISSSLTAKYKKAIEKEFKINDFKYVINTHAHPDHIGGNPAFTEAVIIGHENCLKVLSEKNKDPEKTKANLLKIAEKYNKELQTYELGTDDWNNAFCQKARYQYAYEDLLNDHKIPAWDITFSESLTIFLDDVTLDCIYFGKAHSESDIMIHIPELKLLMIGDLFLKNGKPSIGNVNKQDVERWKSVMQWIKARWEDMDIVVGGHGQIMSKEDLEAFNNYVEEMWKEAK